MRNQKEWLSNQRLKRAEVAKIYFNKPIDLSHPVCAASVTYTIPIVAVLWGVWPGEAINFYQLLGGAVILLGVYLVYRKKRPS